MSDAYEHELVHMNLVNDKLADGWEPVPHVVPVTEHSMATPSTYVFLRRSRTLRRSRPRQ